MLLHYPFGRYRAREDMYYPVTYTQHREIHRELGFGRENGVFNRHYDFDNVGSSLIRCLGDYWW